MDTLTSDAATRIKGRLTEYYGTAWLGGETPGTGGMVIMSNLPPTSESFYVPDSLAYRSELAGKVRLAHSISLVGAGETAFVIGSRVELVADPRGNPVHWLRVTVDFRGRAPIGIAYSVSAWCQEQVVAG